MGLSVQSFDLTSWLTCTLPWLAMKYSAEEKKLILKVYKYFEAEKKRGKPFYSLHDVSKRTAHVFCVSQKYLSRILNQDSKGESYAGEGTSSQSIKAKKEKLQLNIILVNGWG